MMGDVTGEVRTYGHWRRPQAAGLGKLSYGASLGLIGLLVVAVVVYQTGGALPAVGTLAGGGVVVWASSIRDAHGVSVLERVGEVVRHRVRVVRGRHRVRQGPLGRRRGGKFTPPGIASGTRMSEHHDAHDRPFALLEHGDGTLSVVMSVAPSGAGLLDADTVDHHVAAWGGFLANLSGELGIVGASVTVESVPDSGDRLRRHVTHRLSTDGPEVARQILTSVVEEYGAGAAQLRTWVTVTFHPAKMGSKRRGGRAAREIASRLPELTRMLSTTGAGAVHLLRPAEVSRLVRVAFDPASEVVFEEAAAQGADIVVGWADAGPAAGVAGWDYYRHDSAVSRTWVVSRPPRGIVQSHVLRQVLDSHRDITRKRVTVLYQPLDAARAPDVAEKDLTRAKARVDISQRPSARDLSELENAMRVARDEASGAGLVDFAMLVTATSTDGDIDDVAATVEAISAASRLLVRPAYGAQDAAFILSLPLGLSPTSARSFRGW